MLKDQNSYAYHKELFDNEDAVITALRKRKLVQPDLKLTLQEATTRVKTHKSKSKKGKVFLVKQHTRNIAAQNMKIVGATPREEKMLRKILERHDPKVLMSTKSISVQDTKDFRQTVKEVEHSWNVPAWASKAAAVYDESSTEITMHRNQMKVFGWKATLDHELGHASYYHSPETVQWFKAHASDPKFDRFTDYSLEGAHEAFAESYMAYMAANGKAIKERYSKVFRIIDNVVKATNPKKNLHRKYWQPTLMSIGDNP